MNVQTYMAGLEEAPPHLAAKATMKPGHVEELAVKFEVAGPSICPKLDLAWHGTHCLLLCEDHIHAQLSKTSIMLVVIRHECMQLTCHICRELKGRVYDLLIRRPKTKAQDHKYCDL